MGLLSSLAAAFKSGGSKAGGLMGGAQDATSDLGDFRFGPNMEVQGVRPADSAPAPKKPGFFKRINTVDPETGMSTVDKVSRFGARLQDISDGGDRAKDVESMAKERRSQAQQRALAGQIDALFPDDPQMRFLLKSNPEKATAALADVYKSRNEAANVGAGDSRVYGDPNRGGSVFMAPKYGEADGYSYGIDEDGFQWGGQRGRTHGEVETGRHNVETERLGLGNLDVARRNAGTSAGHLGIARERLNFDKSKEFGGAGGVIPPLPPGFRPVR